MDSDVAGVPLLNSDVADDHLLISDIADTHFPNSVGSDADNESSAASSVSTGVYLGSDEVESALLGSDESVEGENESGCAPDCDESLERDLRLLLQDHSDDIVKKWGNSEKWVLELRDGRKVAVPIQFSLPRCVTTEVLDKNNQLALCPLDSSELQFRLRLFLKRIRC